MRDLVFEPFERLGRDADTPGTGLGLAIVRNVVTAHDGRVEIRDRNSGGTIVRIELPAEAVAGAR
jgi:two-component system sensor histidine kinase MprB